MALLNMDKVTEPFNLETALSYMRKNGEFIRCKTLEQDFYMYLEEVRRPVLKNGKRQLVTTEMVWAFNQWGSTALTLNLSDLFQDCFYLMRFDEFGNPDWSDPSLEEEKLAESEVADEGIVNAQ
ncbi:hypothetical protein [Streptococcus himalayensis]|uniref:Phage protein n=1 Tax=Streptococcus himalayensis TaxID=1888195 RepID=A0A917A4I7_9STRE|nr:hypothetical protein [Streptococcus himalayensis]QBX16522.1 hypothetical protein Javan255_0007 [Streptococcus phage Javan255]GGE26829.1 hypothetical protein GCM10011510_05020 [Streptococcus himalayensis]